MGQKAMDPKSAAHYRFQAPGGGAARNRNAGGTPARAINDLTDRPDLMTPDMPLPQADTRFMIVAQARSGSTLLREALNAEPDIVCHGETFSRVWIDRIVPRPGEEAPTPDEIRAMLPGRDTDPLQFMAERVMPFPGKVTGFKIIYDDFIDPVSYTHLTLPTKRIV